MNSKRARLDRFISANTALNRRDVRLAIAQKRIQVNGENATGIHQVVDQFCHITFDNHTLQANTPVYIMLNKPAGMVSATSDPIHQTAVDCLPEALREGIHIVGRLDFNSTGLLLLTNNGAWSRQISDPSQQIEKVYEVELENPVTEEMLAQYQHAFEQGIYFAFENLTTRPAKLNMDLAHPTRAKVTLMEGRYHQIKRMFGHFRNKVTALHRTTTGKITLDPTLKPGEYRHLNTTEIS